MPDIRVPNSERCLRVLQQTRGILRNLLSLATREQLDWRPSSERWSIGMVLAASGGGGDQGIPQPLRSDARRGSAAVAKLRSVGQASRPRARKVLSFFLRSRPGARRCRPAQSEIFTAPFEPRIAGLRFRCVQFQNRARLHNQHFCSALTSEKHRMRFCAPPLPHALLSTVAVHFSLGTSERVIGPVFNGSERCCHGPSRNVFRLLVDLAAVSNARDTDELRRVVDDVYHAPVTDSDAPLIFVAFQFLVLHPAGRGSSASAKIFRSMR